MAKSEKRIVFGLILSCWFVYVCSMCMKMAYSGAMASIKQEYGVSNVTASLPLTLYYSFYAGIQFILALIMTRINLKIYMAVTFTVSGLLFIAVFLFSPMWFIGTALAINGITLGAVWCGSVFIFGKFLSQKTMSNALLFMAIGFSFGSALSYGISALAVGLGNWRISFLIFGIMFLLSTAYMFYALLRAEKAGIKPKEEKVILKKQVYKAEKSDVKPLIIMAIITVFFACLLYYAFTNFMPTIMESLFGTSKSDANLITTIFPAVVYVGPVLAVICCNKFKNDFLVTFTFCVLSAAISLILCFVFDINVILTVAVILALGICLRLLNSLFGSLVSLHTREYVNSGKTAALINAVACVAAAVSPFLISLILDLSGNDWKLSFLVLFACAGVMALESLAFLAVRQIKRKKEKTPIDNAE